MNILICESKKARKFISGKLEEKGVESKIRGRLKIVKIIKIEVLEVLINPGVCC